MVACSLLRERKSLEYLRENTVSRFNFGLAEEAPSSLLKR